MPSYFGQAGAVQPIGIKRKKLRRAPMIQEQAKRGIATRLVTDQKDREQYESEMAFEKEKFAAQEVQWKKDMKQREREFEQRKKYDTVNTLFAGISTAATILDFF